MSEAAETLEREDELDRIAAALDATVAGSGRTLLIEGPAGIGKTRLLQDARALAKIRGLGRLHTTCDEFERAIPWGALRQMVERSLWRHDQDTRAALLAGVAGKALAALDEAPAEGGGEAAIGRTLHALWWIVADLASSRPLLISVDDAQWSDVPSLRFFGYLARRVGDLPVALVIATRPPQERRGPLAELTAARVGEHLSRARCRATPSRPCCGGARHAARGRGRRGDPRCQRRQPVSCRASCSTTSARAARTSAIPARQRSSAASGRARSPAPCSPACPTTRSRWPGPQPCSARAATARWRRRSRASATLRWRRPWTRSSPVT